MAELALGIAGVALAWKGLLDFGRVLSRLTDDDDRERSVIAIGLESSQLRLMDWGEHYGIDNERGRFQQFESLRKTLVIKIIFQLHHSRALAIKRLRKKYGMFTEEEDMKSSALETRLTRMVESFVSVAKTNKNNTRWLSGDNTMLVKLLEETTQLHGYLDQATSMSIKFLHAHVGDVPDTQPLESGLISMEHEFKQSSRRRLVNTRQNSLVHTSQTHGEIDDQTLAGCATDSVMSARKRERILEYIDKSFDSYGDSRVPSTIAAWWNDARSDILVLELPEDVDDETETPACLLLYYLVDCHKLIFIFDSHSQPAQQVLDMMRTFIQGLISVRGNKPFEELRLPISISRMESETVNAATMQQIVDFFLDLLRDLLEGGDKHILLIVDGLELSCYGEENSTHQIIRSFVSGLNIICETTENVEGRKAKVLFAHKGHATSLYECLGDENVVDLTDHTSHFSSFREDLAASLHE